MTTLREAAQQALEALKLALSIIGHPDDAHSRHIAAVISALRAALEQSEQKPVAWLSRDEARLALWQAIHQREFGNPNDDKLILDALRDKGLWIGRMNASPWATALEQPEQDVPEADCGNMKPVAWRYKSMIGLPWSLSDDAYYVSCKRTQRYMVEPLYTHPPRREWRGLTEEEREAAIRWAIDLDNTQFSRTVARAVEAKLKEKNYD